MPYRTTRSKISTVKDTPLKVSKTVDGYPSRKERGGVCHYRPPPFHTVRAPLSGKPTTRGTVAAEVLN